MVFKDSKPTNVFQALIPSIAVLAYWSALFLLSGLRADHFIFGAVILILFYGGVRIKRLRDFLLPLLLVAVVYDSQRFFADYIRGTIHVIEPYEFDKRFFGISDSGTILTPNEWWQKRIHPVLDLIAGATYLIYVFEFLLVAAYFRFFLCKNDTLPERARSMMWAFFVVNILGYITYYVYPAAPPWYVAEYGFGPARLDVQASLAGCARFDEMTGLSFFKEWYGRSADVFGAIPSLHAAYPVLAAYYAFRVKRLRILTVAFSILMAFSAVYLNHHYVIDVILGIGFALFAGAATDLAFALTRRQLSVLSQQQALERNL